MLAHPFNIVTYTQEVSMSNADMGWSRYVAAQEAANDAACHETAARHGLTVVQAEECDDGSCGCPDCPFVPSLAPAPRASTHPHACCAKATHLACVCAYAYDCPDHGRTHVGSHD